jgi:hypothetical protein
VSDLKAQGAHGPAPRLRSRERRRAELPVRYLLDLRLFLLLTAPGREEALEAFRASLARHRPKPGEEAPPDLELTPLALLQALGVDPPRFDFFTLPAEVALSGESLKATSLVVKVIESCLRKSPELQPDSLRKRAESAQPPEGSAARELFDLCVTRVVSREGFEDAIVKQLSFDFLFRFPFPDVLREEVFEFLCASLFATDETVAGLSKMRAIKTLWDRAYPRIIKGNPGARGEIQALDREMKVRTRADLLAGELVHHAVLGTAVGKRFQPVTAFTLDSTERARARAIAYKSALRSFLDQITPQDLASLRSNLDAWRPGALVSCQEDGACEAPMTTGDLPVLPCDRGPSYPLGRRGGSEASSPEPQGEDRGHEGGEVEVEVGDGDAEHGEPRHGGTEGERHDGDHDAVIADLDPERRLPGAEEEP